MTNKINPEDYQISVCGVPLEGLTDKEQEEMEQEARDEGFLTYADWVVAYIDDVIDEKRIGDDDNDSNSVRTVTGENCSSVTASMIEQRIKSHSNIKLILFDYNDESNVLTLEVARKQDD